MRLNKFIAHCGVCSRRAAADLVKNGEIEVNGNIELNPSYMVQEDDQVVYQGKKLKRVKNLIYLLLNKPTGYITSLSDERGRKTVIDLVKDKVNERIYPVGRLDYHTSGLLLLTNDGDLANKLAHPRQEVIKVYHVVLDRPVGQDDIDAIKKGLVLEDGPVEVDGISYVKKRPPNEVGIKLHIGRNRIVRRIFEHLGYEVEKLDRVNYAGLTKKDLPRGWSRHLTEKEIIMLKHFQNRRRPKE